MSDCSPENTQVILCGTDAPQAGTAPYYIGYGDLVDGYRHAWTQTSERGYHPRVRVGRSANHPPDPRCPECHPVAATSGEASS